MSAGQKIPNLKLKMQNSLFLSSPSIITSLGRNDEFFSAILEQKRGLRSAKFLDFDFQVGAIDYELESLPNLTKNEYKTRTNEILFSAILGLDKTIKSLIKRYGSDKIGVVIGTTTAGVEENFAAFGDKFDKSKFDINKNALSNPALFIRDFYSLKNLAFGVSTACTSGIKAILVASNLINLGLCEAVICGGVDSINSLTILGFNSLGVLSQDKAFAFCKGRDGINIGEGAGIFVLCKDEISSLKLKSIASNSDAYHITKPDPSAKMQKKMIKELMNSANLDFLDYVNLHGTGTEANDLMEACVVLETLGSTLCSSIKPNIGHTLAAAGAIECGFCAMAIQKGVVPGQILGEVEFDSLNLPRKNVKKEIKNALNLSFAFGGDNAGMIIGV